MTIAALFNVPQKPEDRDLWAFSHVAHHRDINAAIFRANGFSIPEFVLDPFPVENPAVWLYQHQVVHNLQNAILGISGYDLTGVDLNDIEQLAEWIQANGNEHVQAGAKLGVG